ncbi:MAG: sulfatase-like hydrolase/transferase [Planctomycetaceae bacterium]|nr:sulfatase-like hydrolase/transferase [Planctomycetaceae bacterium]
MVSIPNDAAEPATPGACLRSGAGAGALVGALLGAADAAVAWNYFQSLPPSAWTETLPVAPLDLLLGILGAGLYYGPALALLGALLGLVSTPWLRSRSVARRRGWVLAPLFAGAFGAALFWWTRERFYPGLPVQSPERLLVLGSCAVVALTVALAVAFVSARLPAKWWRPVPALLVLGWVVGGAWIFVDSRASATRGTLNDRNADLPNVLFVMVDALRPDVLGCYGNRDVSTPHMDRLAREGVLFERALVQAPYTWTSFGSFLTGKYPRRHGLLRMLPGERLEQNVTLQRHLKSAKRRDGETLRADDYAGAAFMTGALSHGSGLLDGFDGYLELMKGHPFVQLDSRFSQLRSVMVGPSVAFKVREKLNPDFLSREAADWMADHGNRRFANFVHLYSTHTPYDPAEPFRSLYVDPNYTGPISAFYASTRQAIERGVYELTPEDQRQIFHLYLGGVSEADHHLGLLLAELERQGVLDDTIVIVTSDHGEDFGEGGRWEHNHMYNSNLHVPLLVRWPKAFPAGTRVSATVESIDLFPTLMDAMGLELPPVAGPRDIVDGVSLLPLVRGEVDRAREFFYAEDSTYVAVQDERSMLVLERYAVRPDGWALALEHRTGRIRLHDLEADPLQRRELFQGIVFAEAASAEEGERQAELREKVLAEADRLREALLAWNEHMPIDVEQVERSARDIETERAARAKMDHDARELRRSGVTDEREMRQRLAQLGYTQEMMEYQGDLRELVLEHRRGNHQLSTDARRQ